MPNIVRKTRLSYYLSHNLKWEENYFLKFSLSWNLNFLGQIHFHHWWPLRSAHVHRYTIGTLLIILNEFAYQVCLLIFHVHYVFAIRNTLFSTSSNVHNFVAFIVSILPRISKFLIFFISILRIIFLKKLEKTGKSALVEWRIGMGKPPLSPFSPFLNNAFDRE